MYFQYNVLSRFVNDISSCVEVCCTLGGEKISWVSQTVGGPGPGIPSMLKSIDSLWHLSQLAQDRPHLFCPFFLVPERGQPYSNYSVGTNPGLSSFPTIPWNRSGQLSQANHMAGIYLSVSIAGFQCQEPSLVAFSFVFWYRHNLPTMEGIEATANRLSLWGLLPFGRSDRRAFCIMA